MLKALEKAKEAGRLEKNLRQSRERAATGSSPAEQLNFDLTFSVSSSSSSSSIQIVTGVKVIIENF